MPQTIHTTVVRAFEPKNGIGKSGKPWTRSDFEFQGGLKASTFQGAVASVAASLVGQPVEITYEEEQNGEYTNRTLKSIKAVNGNGADVVGSAIPAQGTANPNIYTFGGTTNNVVEETRQLRIMRQSALDRALTSIELALIAFGLAQQDPLQSLDEVEGLARSFNEIAYALSDESIYYFENGREEE